MPRRPPVFFWVCAGDGGPPQLKLARRSDRYGGGGCRVVRQQLLAGSVVPEALVLVRGNHLRALLVDDETVAALRVCRLPLDDDGANAQLHQVLARIASRVRFLDAARERALAAHRNAAGRRRGGAGEHPGRHHQHVAWAQRVARRVALLLKDLRGESPATQELSVGRKLIEGSGLSRHVDAQDTVAVRRSHGLPPEVGSKVVQQAASRLYESPAAVTMGDATDSELAGGLERTSGT